MILIEKEYRKWRVKTKEELIDLLITSTITTWKNNSLGVKKLNEKCDQPCEDLVFTFAIEGLYYYSRVLMINNQLIELTAIYESADRYNEFKKVYDSFRTL